ncbi:MAG: PRC-barrel domain-containing protein [Bauldia sp.]|nr:PRC-barrel domain-containing protein [Bauldia sp.]
MRLLLTSAAVAALAISGVAIAQQAPDPLAPGAGAPAEPISPAPGGAAPPVSITPPALPLPGAGQDLAAADSRAVGGFIADQLETEFLATDLIGKDVVTASDERLGTINDLLIAEDGSIAGAVLGTGGFLGIGEKQVAVDFGELDIAWNNVDNRWNITSGLTLESINTAPEFVRWTPDAPVGPVGAAPEPAPPMTIAPAPGPGDAPAPGP